MRNDAICVVMVTMVMSLADGQDSQDACSAPQWPNSTHPALGVNPLEARRGRVVGVMLGKGYCSYCVRQAQGLEVIKSRLAARGMPDFDVIVVNGGEEPSRVNVANFRDNVNLTVLQDTADLVLYNQVFHGNKDDFIIYDRCGQRTKYIPHPYSYLGYPYTLRAITRVYRGHHNCFCSLDYNTRSGRRGQRGRGQRSRSQGSRRRGRE